ncbi:ribosome silencing factor [Lacisediminimonas sp.]|uniref:ribosome silencing factor n=1 Tax=Lacisediminimonas sp. TaxID=3060582 RepID=UPI002718E6AD|nr:ribosome silencing factor [Lacisediminimonas sp.]MDO8298427.1 ribosome silencing factor [Lacisediminimonas sp.]
MDIKKLQALVVDALEDVKAQDIVLFDTTHLTSLFDSLAVASGTSNRQTKALAASVRDKVKEAGGQVIGVEGQDTGEWVLVDLGDMIVHIMQPAIRAYYRLEEIWGDKPVKLSDVKRRSRGPVKAVASASSEADKPARRRHIVGVGETGAEVPAAAAKRPTKASAGETASPRAASKTPAKAGAKPAARKTASKTAAKAAPKTGVKSAAGKTAAKSASKTAGKTAAKPTTARKTAAKTPVGKTVKVSPGKTATAGKAPARRTAER